MLAFKPPTDFLFFREFYVIILNIILEIAFNEVEKFKLLRP